MLIRFTVENFLSFKTREEFSMLPGKGRLHPTHVAAGTTKDELPVLHAAVLYGANASGKSNLIKAIAFGQNLVNKGTSSDSIGIEFQNFRLDRACKVATSRLEYEFRINGKNYAYGFVFNEMGIVEEWLFEVFGSRKDRRIFERKLGQDGRSEYALDGITYSSNDERQFLEFTARGTRRNQLLLAECKSRNVRDNLTDFGDLDNVFKWFGSMLRIIHPSSRLQGMEFILDSSHLIQRAFDSLLTYFQTGIHGIALKEVDVDQSGIPESAIREFLRAPGGKYASVRNADGLYFALEKAENRLVRILKITTKHKVTGSDEIEFFEMTDESDGTQRIMDLIPALFDITAEPCVMLIDEIDNSLHPNLVYDFFDFFLAFQYGRKGQLIATTHESRLLSQKLLRKDEIWFMVKNEDGMSSLASLEEFKVRFDKEIRNDYLLGRFGGVPKFGLRSNVVLGVEQS